MKVTTERIYHTKSTTFSRFLCPVCSCTWLMDSLKNITCIYCPRCGTKMVDKENFGKIVIREIGQMSTRTLNALSYAGFQYLDDTAKFSDDDLLKIKNMGKKSIMEIRQLYSELCETS